MSEPKTEERDDCCHMTHEWGTACPLPNPTVVFVDSSPSPADRLAEAFDEWVSLSVKRMPIRPMGGAPSLEELDRAWRKVTQAHEEWSNAR